MSPPHSSQVRSPIRGALTGALLLGLCTGLPSPALRAALPVVFKNTKLNFVRITRIPADLPSNRPPVVSQGDWIVDLRGTSALPKEAEMLSAWLQFQTRPERATFVLVNRHTAPSILSCLQRTEWPALLTLSPDTSGLETDIKVSTADEADTQAVALIENGSSVEELIQPSVQKTRMDEAALSKEHATTGANRFKEPEPANAGAAGEAKQNGEPADRVLAKAVQIQRAVGIFRDKS